MAQLISDRTAIIPWLLSRIQKPPKLIDQNTQSAAEVLAILAQSSAASRRRLIDLDGIDLLMQLLNRYSKRDPVKGSEEEEYAENLFNCLTCCVDDDGQFGVSQGDARFRQGEGIELCIIMLREGKWSRPRALRLLDRVLAGPDAIGCCEHLVNIGGLKTIFGLFLKKVRPLNHFGISSFVVHLIFYHTLLFCNILLFYNNLLISNTLLNHKTLLVLSALFFGNNPFICNAILFGDTFLFCHTFLVCYTLLFCNVLN